MAGLIDEVLVDDLEASNLVDKAQDLSVEEPKVEEKVETNPVNDVPEKYRGK